MCGGCTREVEESEDGNVGGGARRATRSDCVCILGGRGWWDPLRFGWSTFWHHRYKYVETDSQGGRCEQKKSIGTMEIIQRSSGIL